MLISSFDGGWPGRKIGAAAVALLGFWSRDWNQDSKVREVLLAVIPGEYLALAPSMINDRGIPV